MSDRIAVMSSGVALQVGAAHDIYESPNCRFVADFIGETNFLDGSVAGQQGRLLAVNIAGGLALRAEHEAGLPAGQLVTLAVRPEKIHLHAAPGAANQLPGQVEDVVYIGTDTHYGVRLPGGQRLRVREQNTDPASRPLAQAGDAVTVSFDAPAARVLME